MWPTWARFQQQRYQEFLPEIKTEGYPKSYLRNFHYQTDGYLSEMSANLYDLQLERVGFQEITIQHHFMSKYWIARKPLLNTEDGE